VGYEDHLKRQAVAKQERLQRQLWEQNLRMGRHARADPTGRPDPAERAPATVPKCAQRHRAPPRVWDCYQSL